VIITALVLSTYLVLADIDQNAKAILDFFTEGEGVGEAYKRLLFLGDTFGARPSGSEAHAKAGNWIMDQMKQEGLDNVHGEHVTVPRWHRGFESARMLFPYQKKLSMLGLGTSIGTPNTTAEIVVVKNFKELTDVDCLGKIVVINHQCDWKARPLDCYDDTAEFRTRAASHASQQGAVAALVKTVGAFSISSPHTGVQHYVDGIKKIPVAAITIEDAELLQRLYDRGISIVVELVMEAMNLPDGDSFNVIGEVKGYQYPEQIVLVSGHLDSWDVGQGAMDDGAGAIISWMALTALKKLNIRPKRTIQFVGWACEEFGGVGSKQYYEAHKSDIANYDLVMESDMGVFLPFGVEFTGSSEAQSIVERYALEYLNPINASRVVSESAEGTDVDWWGDEGVPSMSLLIANEKYFWFHHSEGDMINILDSREMDLSAAVWSIMAYAVADSDEMLPRQLKPMARFK